MYHIVIGVLYYRYHANYASPLIEAKSRSIILDVEPFKDVADDIALLVDELGHLDQGVPQLRHRASDAHRLVLEGADDGCESPTSVRAW